MVEGKVNRISGFYVYVDLFHRRQLIKQLLIPAFNHVFMDFGHDAQAEDRLDGLVRQLPGG